MSYTAVTAAEFADLGLDDWRFVLGSIRADFRTGSFPGAWQDRAQPTTTSAN